MQLAPGRSASELHTTSASVDSHDSFSTFPSSPTPPLLCSLNWLSVASHITFKTLMLANKAKNGLAPSYLKALIALSTAP